MNLEMASMGSPRKRRSLGATLGADFNVFDQGFDGTTSDSADSAEEKDVATNRAQAMTALFGSPAHHQSPQRRSSNLRRTTLQQRAGPGRTRLFPDASNNQKLGRAGSRMSLMVQLRTCQCAALVRSHRSSEAIPAIHLSSSRHLARNNTNPRRSGIRCLTL